MPNGLYSQEMGWAIPPEVTADPATAKLNEMQMKSQLLDAIVHSLAPSKPAQGLYGMPMAGSQQQMARPQMAQQPMQQPQAQPQQPTAQSSYPTVPSTAMTGTVNRFTTNKARAQMKPNAPNTGGGGGWGEFLKAMGIPLLSAGVGMIAPNALAGAAGMSEGYASGYEKQQERQLKQKELAKKDLPHAVHIVDKNGKILKTLMVGPEDSVKMAQDNTFSFGAGNEQIDAALGTKKPETTTDTARRVTNEVFNKIPNANNFPEGYQLKSNGVVTHINVGGEWQPIQ